MSKYCIIDYSNEVSRIVRNKDLAYCDISGEMCGQISSEEDIDEKLRDQFSKCLEIREYDQLTVNIITTYNCNFNCTYCYEKTYKSNRKYITAPMTVGIQEFIKEYIKTYDLNSSKMTLNVSGGEPLLEKNRELIKVLTKLEDFKTINLYTNATLLANYQNLISPKINLIISLDGTRDMYFENRTTQGDNKTIYSQVLRNIKWAVNNKNTVLLTTVFNPSYGDRYYKFLDLLEHMGWPNNGMKVKFIPECNGGCDEIDVKYFKESLKVIRTLYDKDPRFSNISFVRFSQGYGKQYEFMQLQKESKDKIMIWNCYANSGNAITFAPNGNVYACPMIQDDKLKIGTYFPYVKIDNNNVNRIKERNILNLEKCKECDKRLICRGGCLASEIKAEGTMDLGYCGYWRNK